ncbi:MAG: hypothetical protein K9I29_10105 [Bacteroidales bacterium]|nr:hypothetical protein [Bacteroidales bacterium]MCF8328634.1 hypothetical protein [Bacteroidales bacterium]
MRPVKSLFPLFSWLIRIAILLAVYTRFFQLLKTLDFSSVSFYIAAAFHLFALLLFLAGFAKKHTLTILSGIIIAGLSIYQIVQLGFVINNNLSFYGLLLSASLLFIAVGNKK